MFVTHVDMWRARAHADGVVRVSVQCVSVVCTSVCRKVCTCERVCTGERTRASGHAGEQKQLQRQSLPSTHFPEGQVLPRRPGAAPTQLQQPQLELASLSTPQRLEGADHT